MSPKTLRQYQSLPQEQRQLVDLVIYMLLVRQLSEEYFPTVQFDPLMIAWAKMTISNPSALTDLE